MRELLPRIIEAAFSAHPTLTLQHRQQTMLLRLMIGHRCSHHLGPLAKVDKAGKPVSNSLVFVYSLADETTVRVVALDI